MLNSKQYITDFTRVKNMYQLCMTNIKTFVKQKNKIMEIHPYPLIQNSTSTNFSWGTIKNVHKDLHSRVFLMALL